MLSGIILYKRYPPTPFNINQLHLVVALSPIRQQNFSASAPQAPASSPSTPIESEKLSFFLPIQERPSNVNRTRAIRSYDVPL